MDSSIMCGSNFVFPFTTISDAELNYLSANFDPTVTSIEHLLNSQLDASFVRQTETDLIEDISEIKLSTGKCSYITLDTLFTLDPPPPSQFSILQLSCRSIKRNFDKIKLLLSHFKTSPSVISLSETWIPNDCMNKLFSLQGYNFISKPRPGNKRGGGVALYVDTKFSYSEVSTYAETLDSVCEHCIVEIHHDHCPNVIVASIYKPPDTDISLFNACFTTFLEQVTATNKILYIVGDTNIDLLKYQQNDKITNFLDQALSFGLLPTILYPTRITSNSSTLIDNIFTNRNLSDDTSYIMFDDLSDHLPILLQTNLSYQTNPKPIQYTETKRIYSSINFSRFESLLQRIDWFPLTSKNDFLNINSPTESYNLFYSKFYKAFNQAFPKVTTTKNPVNNKNKHTPPWLTKSIFKSCQKKSRLLKKYKRTNSPQDKLNYTRYKNSLKSIIRNEEKRYYEQEFNLRLNDSKRTWKFINEIQNKNAKLLDNNPISKLCVNGVCTTQDSDIVNELNQFFTSIGANLANKIPTHNINPASFMSPKTCNTFMLFP